MYPEADIVPRQLSRLVYLIAFIKLCIHIAFINGYGIFRDELYYVVCGRHLAWGYVEFPPLIGLISYVVTSVLGESLFAIRILPAIAGAGLVVLAGMLARELGGGRFAQALAALSILAATVWMGLNHVFSPNAFEPLFWMGCALIFLRIVRTRNEKLWLWFGALAGLGLMNKHSMLFFGFALVAGIILARQYRYLINRWFWLGGAIAFLIFLPHLIWQVQTGMPQLELLRNAEKTKNLIVGPWQFFLGQILILNPVTFPLWLGGLVFLLIRKEARFYRALGWAYLVLFVTMIVLHGKNYYLAPAHPMLLAAGAVWLERVSTGSATKWLRPFAATVVIAGTIIVTPLALPVLPPETYIRYSRALGVDEVATERHTRGPLPQFYADMFGWKELADRVAEVYRTLPPEERAKTGIFAQNYGEAGAVDYFGPHLGLPPAISGHNSYWLWGPLNYNSTLIVIGGKEEGARKVFDEVTPAAKTFHPYAMPYENDQTVWICRKPHVDLKSAWRMTKKYM